jgi:hypothetical protein
MLQNVPGKYIVVIKINIVFEFKDTMYYIHLCSMCLPKYFNKFTLTFLVYVSENMRCMAYSRAQSIRENMV